MIRSSRSADCQSSVAVVRYTVGPAKSRSVEYVKRSRSRLRDCCRVSFQCHVAGNEWLLRSDEQRFLRFR